MVKKITNHLGQPLTLRESRFIDNYMLTGNITESYRKAFGKPDAGVLPEDTEEIKKKKSIALNRYLARGKKLMNRETVSSEINYRLDKQLEANIISVNEIYGYLSRVVRGEEKDQFGLDVSVSERTKAATELLKRFVDIPNKLEKNEPQEVKITLDWNKNKGIDEVIDVDVEDKSDTKIGQITTQVGD